MTQLFGISPNSSAIGRDDNRKTAKEVDYMELPGAVKDADCRRVRVEGGVSKQLGCCNDFKLNPDGSRLFSCGTCKFLID